MTTVGRIRRGARVEALAARTAAKVNRLEEDNDAIRRRLAELELTRPERVARALRAAIDHAKAAVARLTLATRRRVERLHRRLRRA